MFFDTHCHLDMYKNPEKNLKISEKQRVFIIGVTLKPSHFKMGLPFIQKYKNIRFALGLHPLHAHEHSDFELNLFKEYVGKTSYIGEVGLDFSKQGEKTKDVQVDCFRSILGLIKNEKKVISLHSRKAEIETLSVLNEYKIKHAIFHWYTGSRTLLPKIIDSGYFFSINPGMLKAKSGIEIIKSLPLDRILTETDGPYQNLNGKPISPFDIIQLYGGLSKTLKISVGDLEDIVENNFKRLIAEIR